MKRSVNKEVLFQARKKEDSPVPSSKGGSVVLHELTDMSCNMSNTPLGLFSVRKEVDVNVQSESDAEDVPPDSDDGSSSSTMSSSSSSSKPQTGAPLLFSDYVVYQ